MFISNLQKMQINKKLYTLKELVAHNYYQFINNYSKNKAVIIKP